MHPDDRPVYQLFHAPQAGFVNHERHDARSGHVLPLLHEPHAVQGGQGNLADAVDGGQGGHIHFQNAATVGGKIDAPLLGFAQAQMRAAHRSGNAGGGIVLVHQSGGGFKDIEMFLAHIQQNGNVLLAHHMSLAKDRPLALPRHNAGNIVTEHRSHGLAHVNDLHRRFCHISSEKRPAGASAS